MSDNDVTTATTDSVPAGAVVVGVDGTEKDQAVIEWAAHRAARGGSPLHILRARTVLAGVAPGMSPLDPGVLETLEQVDDSASVESAVELARRAEPDLVVSSDRPWGTGPQALLAASETASLVVVGSARKKALEQAVLGTTSLAVAMHASCPVAVIPEGCDPLRDGPIVVGVDGSKDSALALERAFEQGVAQQRPVVGLAAWHLEVIDGVVVTTPENPRYAEVEERYRAMVARIAERPCAEHPDVDFSIRVVRAAPDRALIEASGEAGSVVVGSRGRGGFVGRLLGSVSHRVLQQAQCPVIVVRAADDRA
ncbi:MAG: universal stress protein [Micrococcales bacterium]|nr:universal stress protein [Micrococcales bacterium]